MTFNKILEINAEDAAKQSAKQNTPQAIGSEEKEPEVNPMNDEHIEEE